MKAMIFKSFTYFRMLLQQRIDFWRIKIFEKLSGELSWAMVTSRIILFTLWWCQFYILMNQRWVVAEIREIWCKNAVTSSEQHKVQGLSLDCRQARPQPPWSQSRPKWILRCYATLWDFFTELKLKFLETSLILRGTVKNVALELGPSERKTVLLSLLKFSFCPWHWVNYCIHFRMVLWRF